MVAMQFENETNKYQISKKQMNLINSLLYDIYPYLYDEANNAIIAIKYIANSNYVKNLSKYHADMLIKQLMDIRERSYSMRTSIRKNRNPNNLQIPK
jgi:uncharacterized protein (UPF0297 family)